MFAKSGKLTYRQLISSMFIRNKDGKALKLTYKNFLKGMDNPTLLSLIVATIRKRPYVFSTSPQLDMEENYFKNSLHQSLTEKLASMDLKEQTNDLALRLLRIFLPRDSYWSPLDYDLSVIQTRRLPGDSTEDLCVLAVWSELQKFFENFLSEDLATVTQALERVPVLKPDGTPRMLMKKGMGLVPYPPVLPTYSTTIEHWIDLSVQWDRLLEVLSIDVRA
jgi:hypothetical protein